MVHIKLEAQELKTLYGLGATASLLQLFVIILYTLVMAIFGPRITSAEEFFVIQKTESFAVLLRGDLLLLVLVGLYLGNFPALLVSLWQTKPLTTLFAFLFTIIAVSLSFAGESSFSLFHLGKLYAAAGSDIERSQFVAAGEAILANGWWNSTGSYVTGILLQGSGVMISIVMLKSVQFSKITGFAGLIGNSFDLLQHLLAPFTTGISEYLSFAMILYLVWYPMLARDLFRLAKNQVTEG